jgi:hypothetical protein
MVLGATGFVEPDETGDRTLVKSVGGKQRITQQAGIVFRADRISLPAAD